MTAALCQACGRTLAEGESAWADEWRVVDVENQTAEFRTEVRYTCDECEAAA